MLPDPIIPGSAWADSKVRDVVYAESPEHAIGAGTVVRVIEREMKR